MTKILLAEDDDSMRAFLERALAGAGYDVVALGDGQAAYDRQCDESFELLLILTHQIRRLMGIDRFSRSPLLSCFLDCGIPLATRFRQLGLRGFERCSMATLALLLSFVLHGIELTLH